MTMPKTAMHEKDRPKPRNDEIAIAGSIRSPEISPGSGADRFGEHGTDPVSSSPTMVHLMNDLARRAARRSPTET